MAVDAEIMNIIKLCWAGTWTDDAGPTVAFSATVLGLQPEPLGEDLWVATLPDGGRLGLSRWRSLRRPWPGCRSVPTGGSRRA